MHVVYGEREALSRDNQGLDLESRRIIDVAIGILMGLRGCSQNEAADEFVSAVDETGIGSAELGRALANLASGKGPSPFRAEALHRWGRLVGLRERPVRVRYGRYNESTIC